MIILDTSEIGRLWIKSCAISGGKEQLKMYRSTFANATYARPVSIVRKRRQDNYSHYQ